MEIIRETGFRKPDVIIKAYHHQKKWQEQILIVVYINWECGDLLLKWYVFNDCNKEIRTFLVIANLPFAEWKCIKVILKPIYFCLTAVDKTQRMSLKRDFSSVRVNGVFFSLSLIYALLSYSQFHNGHAYCCKRCCSFIGGESRGS